MPFDLPRQAERPSNSDLGLTVINRIYDRMRVDAEWSVWEARGFTWWGWHSAQRVWSEPAVNDRGLTLYRLHARAELFDGFENTDEQVSFLNLLGIRQMTLSGILAPADRPGRIELAASVCVHQGNLSWVPDVFNDAVAMQAAEAAIIGASLTDTVGLRRVTSVHPKSGPRGEMDDMLDIFKNLVNPTGEAPSVYAGEEMEQLVAKFQRAPCVWASGDKSGLAAEFPYPGETSLIQLETMDKHPRAGNGLLARLKIPEGKCDAATAREALEWNKKELASVTWARFLGTWCAMETGLTYVSFYPNYVGCCPNSGYQKGCLEIIVNGLVVRAQWITEQVMGYSWNEHFEEPLERMFWPI
jgi:hypothetical protein